MRNEHHPRLTRSFMLPSLIWGEKCALCTAKRGIYVAVSAPSSDPVLPSVAPRAPDAELNTTLDAPCIHCKNKTPRPSPAHEVLTGPDPLVRLCCPFPTTGPQRGSPHLLTRLHTASLTEVDVTTGTPAERRERYPRSRETARPCSHTCACTTSAH